MVSERQVYKSQEKTPWDLGNKILYELCEKYPYHEKDEQIIAKIWLIGRSYAAAIERRKIGSMANDNFYTRIVAPTLKRSKIDEWLEHLSKFRFPTEENVEEILIVHKKTMNIFEKITGMKKRSLASKYLHFHKPTLFFLYDSRALEAIRSLTESIGKLDFSKADVDSEYARFCLRCIHLRNEIKEEYEVHLTPREIDNILLTF